MPDAPLFVQLLQFSTSRVSGTSRLFGDIVRGHDGSIDLVEDLEDLIECNGLGKPAALIPFHREAYGSDKDGHI